MVAITLPDNSVQTHDGAVTGLEIAAAIGKGLAKAAVAIRVNGQLWDLARAIETDSEIAIVTRETAEGREILRHDAAHVLAEAV